jgi:putative heme transporter
VDRDAADVTANGAVRPTLGSRLRRFAPLIVAAVVVPVVFAVVLPRIADYGEVWGAMKQLTPGEASVLVALTALNVLTYAPPFQVALPGLGFPTALRVTLASTASTYVAPGGAVVGIGLSLAMLRARGFRSRDVALAVTVTGIWNQLVLFGSPALGLGLLTLEGTREHGLLLTAGLVGLVCFVGGAAALASALASRPLAHTVGRHAAIAASFGLRLVRRAPVTWGGDNLVEFRRRTIGLLRRRWSVLTLTTVAGHGTVFLVLVGCLRAVGVEGGDVDAAEAFAAWSLVRLAASLPLSPPGGLGIVELGLTGSLVGFGGGAADVTAAVLLYRFLTIAPTLALGTLSMLTWRRQNPGAR